MIYLKFNGSSSKRGRASVLSALADVGLESISFSLPQQQQHSLEETGVSKVDLQNLYFGTEVPVAFTLDVHGYKYQYKKGWEFPTVELPKPCYRRYNESWCIGSPLPLEEGKVVTLNRKDSSQSNHLVGVKLRHTHDETFPEHQTWFYQLGKNTLEPATTGLSMSPQKEISIEDFEKQEDALQATEAIHKLAAACDELADRMLKDGITLDPDEVEKVAATMSAPAKEQSRASSVVGSMAGGIKNDATRKQKFRLDYRDGIKRYEGEATSWREFIVNLLREGKSFEEVNFSGLKDFTNLKFEVALKNAIFNGADFSGSTYAYGDLDGALFESCTFDRKTSFRGTTFTKHTVFRKCDLSTLAWRDCTGLATATLEDVSGVPQDFPKNKVLRQTKSGVQYETSFFGSEVQWVLSVKEDTTPLTPGTNGSVQPKYSEASEASTPSTTVNVSEIRPKGASMAKQSIKEMVLSDSEKALYRIGAKNVVKLGKQAILKALEVQGSDQAAAMSLMLHAELGDALVSAAMGGVLTAMPQFQNDVRVQTLATELRVNGMATVGNLIVDQLGSILIPTVSALVQNLPEVSATAAKTVTAPPAESSVFTKPTLVQPKAPQPIEEEDDEAEEAAEQKSKLSSRV
mgnify:CR=1 FL=1